MMYMEQLMQYYKPVIPFGHVCGRARGDGVTLGRLGVGRWKAPGVIGVRGALRWGDGVP